MTTIEMLTDNQGATTRYGAGTRFTLSSNRFSQQLALKLQPNTRYAVQMIPIPDGYRLATNEDRKGPKPARTKYWSCSSFWKWPGNGGSWVPDAAYIVPIEPETVEVQVLGKKKTITRKQAQELGLL